jgi:hypothetical protein
MPTTTTAAAPTPTRAFSLATVVPSSADGSFHSFKSNGSLGSLPRNSPGKLISSSLPRRRRSRKEPQQMTWLRDTLSLNSSTHTDLMLGMESEDEAASESGSEFGGGSDVGNGRSTLELGATAVSNGDSSKSPRQFSFQVRARASPALLACLREDIDFPDLPVISESSPQPLPPPELPPLERPQPAPTVGAGSKVSSTIGEDSELDPQSIVREKSDAEGDEDEEHEVSHLVSRLVRCYF